MIADIAFPEIARFEVIKDKLMHVFVEGFCEALIKNFQPKGLPLDGALDAISSMARIKGGVVGAGTLLTPKDVKDAKAAGAQFGVSPGATDILISACESVGLPLLVGAATASESMKLLEKGYSVQKFFPAEASGGAKTLSSFASPLPQIKFCPTGGILPKNATDYLMLQNVICVGGSWVAPKDLVTAGKWDAIEALAKIASEL